MKAEEEEISYLVQCALLKYDYY